MVGVHTDYCPHSTSGTMVCVWVCVGVGMLCVGVCGGVEGVMAGYKSLTNSCCIQLRI